MGFSDWLFSPPVSDRIERAFDRFEDWADDHQPGGPSKYVQRNRERQFQTEQRQGIRGRETLRRERRERSAQRRDRVADWLDRRAQQRRGREERERGGLGD